jgi:hypothetical protein
MTVLCRCAPACLQGMHRWPAWCAAGSRRRILHPPPALQRPPAARPAPLAGAGGGGCGGGGGQAPAQQRLDEAFYLRQLAKERFDPQLFATVFTSGGSGAPGWLNGLIAEPGKPCISACLPTRLPARLPACLPAV